MTNRDVTHLRIERKPQCCFWVLISQMVLKGTAHSKNENLYILTPSQRNRMQQILLSFEALRSNLQEKTLVQWASCRSVDIAPKQCLVCVDRLYYNLSTLKPQCSFQFFFLQIILQIHEVAESIFESANKRLVYKKFTKKWNFPMNLSVRWSNRLVCLT